MKFKAWLEMSDIRNMPTDHIALEPIEEFDEEEAERECEREVEYDEPSGIYDYPEEDPNFNLESPEEWRQENPKPKYEDYFGDLDGYNDDLEEWKEDKAGYEEKYERKAKEWEKEMSKKRYAAEENNDRWEKIQDCIETKKQTWLKENNKGFKSKFDHNGENFEVTLEKVDMAFNGIDIPDAYTIEFTGANDFSTTGTAGTSATAIYSKVLLVIKKFLNDHEVNGLHCKPQEPAMATIYQRFFEKFLKGQFLKISEYESVRKEYIQSLMKNMNPAAKQAAYSALLAASQNTKVNLQKINAGKGEERRLRKLSQTISGRVMKTTDGANFYVAKVMSDTIEGIKSKDGSVPHVMIIPHNVITSTPSSMEEGKELLTAISKNQKWASTLTSKCPFYQKSLTMYGVINAV